MAVYCTLSTVCAWQLEEAGYQVKIQAWDFSPGGNFVVEMQKATVECECTIVVVTPDGRLVVSGSHDDTQRVWTVLKYSSCSLDISRR